MRILAILVVVLVVGFLSTQPAQAEIYKWTDDKGGVHFTEDPSAIPEKYRENTKTRSTADDALTPQEKVKKQREEQQKSRSVAPEPDNAEKNREQRRERANQFCSKASRLQRNIDHAKAEYYAYSLNKYATRSMMQSYYNDIVLAQKELDDFEDQARKNGIPPGWLRCQFE